MDVNPIAEIVTVQEVLAHPNADALDLISPDGSNVNYAIVARGTVKVGDKVVWLDAMNEPVVPMDRAEFKVVEARAKGRPTYRIKAIRLRGVVSRGLIIPYRPEYGDTNEAVIAALGVTKWEPPANMGKNGHAGGSIHPGIATSGPDYLLPTSKYDVDSLARGWREIPEGAEVALTEKIHGANAAYGWLLYQGEMEFRARSRGLWKARWGGGTWWAPVEPMGLDERLKPYPGLILYGEVYGQVQDLKYGVEDVAFVAFDVYDTNTNQWFTWDKTKEFCNTIGVPHVPEIGRVVWPATPGIPPIVREASDGATLMPNATHTREGLVARWDGADGRHILKLVGNGYLTR